MVASGHASIEMHDRYVNVKEHHLADFFKKMQTACIHEKHPNGDQAVSG
jgi:hypothetical protein